MSKLEPLNLDLPSSSYEFSKTALKSAKTKIERETEADRGVPRVSDSTVRAEASPPENSMTEMSPWQPRAPSCSPLSSASIEVSFPSSIALKVPCRREWRCGGAA